jgi:hypothetical protein
MSNVVFRLFLEKLGGRDANNFIGQPGDIFYDPAVAGKLRQSDGETPGGIVVQAGNVSSMSDLSDVDDTGIMDGDVLVYDSGSGKYVASNLNGGVF